MGRDNKRHPNGTVLIEPRSSAKPISEAPVPLLAAVIPVVLAPAAPPVLLLATWDITVPLLLAEPLNALALGASEAVCSVCLAAALTAISMWYFSQPCTPPKKSVDGFFLQNSSSLMPCLQDSHLALYAWQQFLYF